MRSMRQMMEKYINRPEHQDSFRKTVKEILEFDAVQDFVDQHQTELSQEMISNSLSKLNEFVIETKAQGRGEAGQNPGFTPQLFINSNYIDITYVPTQEYYDYSERRKRKALLDNRMMSADVRSARLADVTFDTPKKAALMEEVADFVEQYRQAPLLAKGLYIYGPFGVGKTFLLGALANELVKQNVGVTMLHYPTFTTEIKGTISLNTTQATLNNVKKVPILILDDIGAESNSAWLRDEVLAVILEYRMKESLATFFTSNFSMNDLQTHLSESRDGVERVKANRLMERVRFLAKEVALDGENRRHHAQ